MKPYLIKARAVYEPNGYGGATGLLVREGKIARVGDLSVKHPFFWETQTAWRLLEGVEKYPQDRIQGNDQHERHQQIPKHFYRN